MTKKTIETRKKLAVQQLRRQIDPTAFDFDTTEEVKPLEGTIGQKRALEALESGMDIKAPGFNIYAAGRVGTGRNSTIISRVTDRAKKLPTPKDWCYVYNFDEPDKPQAVSLEPGKGCELAEDMEDLLGECKEEIPKAFEGEEYERQRNEVMQEFQKRRGKLIDALRDKAKELDHAIHVSPAGIVAVPVIDEKEISQEEFSKLEKEVQEDLREKNNRVQELIGDTISRARKIEKEVKEKAEELDRKVGLFAVGHLVDQLKEKYSDVHKLPDYFEKLKDDIIDNIALFRGEDDAQHDPMGIQQQARRHAFNKYRVNVLVDNSSTEGAPVIEERNPTYYNLFGQIEYDSQFGGMSTDFTMIKAGAMLRANGGYITLQVLDLLLNPFAWEGLKRTLCTQQAQIENMWEQYRPIPVATLVPEPIPVNVKVILVGSPILHELLYFLDKDFRRLFKIKADFDVEMKANKTHFKKYAAFISSQCEQNQIPQFDNEGIAKLIEFGLRLAGRQDKLSTEFMQVADVIVEAAQHAESNNKSKVTGGDVSKALETREKRLRMVQDKLQDMIVDDEIIIDTKGAVPGQINGLAVLQLGGHSFGKPSRITCVTSVGKEGVVNIERESKMSGSIHDKGVMILSGYISRQFGQDKPISLSASLCFEQTYSQIDGDSASCAELYALLSSLADVPLRQDIAVTGSVNQFGQVQPIGGVNEKIEGFFEICKRKRFNGKQGVMIPSRNVNDLMLKEEVVEAVEKGKFNVYAVDDVTEGIEILTGMPAGKRGKSGSYPAKSVFGRVDKRLSDIANILKEFGKADKDNQADKSQSKK